MQGILGGILNFMSAGTDAYFQRQQQQQEFEQQKSLLNTQNKFTLDMYNLNNEFNSPANQIQRMIAAGISPAAAAQAVAGSPSSATGSQVSSSSAPSVNSAIGASSPMSSVFSDLFKNRLLAAQTEQQIAETGRYNEVTDKAIEEATERINKMRKEGRLTDAQAETCEQLMPYLVQNSQADLIKKQLEFQQIKNQTDLLLSQKNVADKQAGLIESQTKGVDLDNLKKTWEKFFRDTFNVDPSSPWVNNLITMVLSGKSDVVISSIEQTLETLLSFLNGDGADDSVTNFFTNPVGYGSYFGKKTRKYLFDMPFRFNTKLSRFGVRLDHFGKRHIPGYVSNLDHGYTGRF